MVNLVLICQKVCLTRYVNAYSENEMMLVVNGRSLKMTLDDYNDPTANRGHDPSQRNKNGGGRKG